MKRNISVGDPSFSVTYCIIGFWEPLNKTNICLYLPHMSLHQYNATKQMIVQKRKQNQNGRLLKSAYNVGKARNIQS